MIGPVEAEAVQDQQVVMALALLQVMVVMALHPQLLVHP
jgi:hypothetical protein